MQAVRTLMGAVVGGALGALVVVGLGQSPVPWVRDGMWAVVIVGLLAGLSMKLIASDGHVSFIRGGLTALVAVLAFMGGKYSVGEITGMQAPQATELPAVADIADATGDGAEGAGDVNLDDIPEAPARVASGAPRQEIINVGPPKKVQTYDAIWLAVGALVAYQIGKGTECPPKGEEGEEPAEGEETSHESDGDGSE